MRDSNVIPFPVLRREYLDNDPEPDPDPGPASAKPDDAVVRVEAMETSNHSRCRCPGGYHQQAA